MSFFAALTCQHGHRHEGARCDRSDCQLCCTELRECDIAKFVRHLLRNDETISAERRAVGQ